LKVSGRHLLGQLTAAEAALRTGLHTHGFGSIAREHMERARGAHSGSLYRHQRNQPRPHRGTTGERFVRVQQVMDAATRGKSQRI